MGRFAEMIGGPATNRAHAGLMEKAGLVARRERESDRRSSAISLMAKGKRLCKRILPLTLSETDRALTGFSWRRFGLSENE